MYHRRVIAFLVLVALVFAVIVTRLVQLQLVSGEAFRQEITRRTWQADVLPAGRGHILDRTGAILAVDEPCFDLCVDYRLLFTWADDGSTDPARQMWRRKVESWQRQQRKAALASLPPPAGPLDARQLRDLGADLYRQRADKTWRWCATRLDRTRR